MTQGALDWYQTAHPRVSGENDVPLAREEMTRGSSPRERGKLDQLAGKTNNLRLIPA